MLHLGPVLVVSYKITLPIYNGSLIINCSLIPKKSVFHTENNDQIMNWFKNNLKPRWLEYLCYPDWDQALVVQYHPEEQRLSSILVVSPLSIYQIIVIEREFQVFCLAQHLSFLVSKWIFFWYLYICKWGNRSKLSKIILSFYESVWQGRKVRK